jgi:hypothetical protein
LTLPNQAPSRFNNVCLNAARVAALELHGFNINPTVKNATTYDESAIVGITQIQVEPEPSNSLPVSTVTIRQK